MSCCHKPLIPAAERDRSLFRGSVGRPADEAPRLHTWLLGRGRPGRLLQGRRWGTVEGPLVWGLREPGWKCICCPVSLALPWRKRELEIK